MAVDNTLMDMFVFETNQMIDQLENILIDSESNGISGNIDEIFRIMHTIKGSAAMMMFDDISHLAHSIEDLFFFLREKNPTNVDYSRLTDLVLDGMDFIKNEIDTISRVGSSDAKSDEMRETIRSYLEELKAMQPDKETPAPEGGFPGPSASGHAPTIVAPQTISASGFDSAQNEGDEFSQYEFASQDGFAYIINVMFEEGCGMEHIRAFELVNRLSYICVELRHIPDDIDSGKAQFEIQKNGVKIITVSELEQEDITAYIEQTPLVKNFSVISKNLKAAKNADKETNADAEADLGMNVVAGAAIGAGANAGLAAGADMYEYAHTSAGAYVNESEAASFGFGAAPAASVTIGSAPDVYAGAAAASGVNAGFAAANAPGVGAGTRAVASSAVATTSTVVTDAGRMTSPQVGTAVSRRGASGAAGTQGAQGAVSSQGAQGVVGSQGAAGAGGAESGGAGKQGIISVNISKLDKLMNLVGELVTSESMVSQNPDLDGLQLNNFNKAARQLQKIIHELQDVSMSVRMVPLSLTFQKMHRIVRDMCRKLGKEVSLEIIGEETEVDKNIIEQITNPLMHLIRNSVDHGIEMPQDRENAGKRRGGVVTLEAKNESGDVWIIVRDDGQGLDKNKIYEKAQRNGLTTKSIDELTDREINQFILAPGFSTNEAVTEYSGRGVGMDVVVKGIENVGGSVMIDSKEGEGSQITIKIPLTLAIMEGMIVNVGETNFVIPITSIKESFKANDKYNIAEVNGDDIIMIRGEPNQIICLKDRFMLRGKAEDYYDGIMILVENDTRKVCLFVDAILGQRQVVVKPLPGYIKEVRGISGCTLLGDGSISLILDVAEFLL